MTAQSTRISRWILVAALLAAPLAIDTTPAARAAETDSGKKATMRLACTTFPIWIFTRNVVAGIVPLEVDLILPAMNGCPHDYEPAPQEIRRALLADALVINGLELDNAFVAPLQRERAGFPVIDASFRERPLWIKSGATFLPSEIDGPVATGWATNPAAPAIRPPPADDHDHAHHGGEWNPHYFASPDEAALAVLAIAKGVKTHFGPYLNSAQNQMLVDNTERYVKELRQLAEAMRQSIRKLPNRRIVTFHDSFDYFARDLGLLVVGAIETHAGVEPSPAELKRLITVGRNAKAGGVFSEPAYNPDLAMVVAAGIRANYGELDAVASGPIDAPLDYYQTVMVENLNALTAALTAPPSP